MVAGTVPKHGPDGDGIPDLGQWSRLPVLTREDVQDHYDALRSTGVPNSHGRVLEATTSGSTGRPIRVRRTKLAHAGAPNPDARCRAVRDAVPMQHRLNDEDSSMEFTTKIAIVVAEDLPVWQKLNVVAFLTSGIVAESGSLTGAEYKDASGASYSPLCIQPVVVLKSTRERLSTILQRANSREVRTAIYIEDMFETGHDEANRETVTGYTTETLPLVGIGMRADRKTVDKVTKGAKLHD